MKVGIVDLDTSHPAAWIPIERELGATIVGIWDGGAVHPASYVENFVKEQNAGCVFDSLEQMAEQVDLAIIHGCDWDTHLDKARVFIEAGKAVLVDKPVAGQLEHLQQFGKWAKAGARIFGGSSLRYAAELTTWQAQDAAERGTPHTVLSGCAVDNFNYGIHAYTFACAAMGAGVARVRWVSDQVQQRVELQWADGRTAWVVVGEQAGGWMPFYATLVTERGVTQMQPDAANLYRAFLQRVWPWLSGKAAQPPCPFEAMIEPELAALAALQSRKEGGQVVAIGEIDPSIRYDGAAFAQGYRKAKYG